jgi:hypothetical protein
VKTFESAESRQIAELVVCEGKDAHLKARVPKGQVDRRWVVALEGCVSRDEPLFVQSVDERTLKTTTEMAEAG